MVIDALRFTFVSQHTMPYTFKETNVDGPGGCLLKLKTNVPTVTMPRIKSLTLGTISNFIDVILNFGSAEISQDSIIHQMYKRGDKIVFYGDNTWTNMFPDKFYRRYENTDSFFVQDFYEGDKNITQGLKSEFNNTDWNAIILHYLGLDHIGHVEGSFSSKIQSKLMEMDNVVEEIVESLISMDSEDRNTSLSSILIVTADHGMRYTGGHGGSSPEEIYVPLIVFNKDCNTNNRLIYNQIDFASTVSILLGTNIPASSVGSLITEVLEILPMEDQLFGFYYNTKHLMKKVVSKHGEDFVKSKEYWSWYNTANDYHMQYLMNKNDVRFFKEAKKNYIFSSREISSVLAASLIQFDVYIIILGMCLSTLSAIKLGSEIVFEYRKSDTRSKSTSLLLSILVTVAFALLTQILKCKYSDSSVYLCPPSSLNLAILCAVILTCVLILHSLCKLTFTTNIQIPLIITLVTIFQVISLSSSSFIEEEHQIWYYICTTSLIILTGYLIYNEIHWKELTFVNKVNMHQIKEIHHYKIPISMKLFEMKYSNSFTLFLLLAMHVLVRRLNQTGDKWLHLTDIGDWLCLEENKIQLSLVFMVGEFKQFGNNRRQSRFYRLKKL